MREVFARAVVVVLVAVVFRSWSPSSLFLFLVERRNEVVI